MQTTPLFYVLCSHSNTSDLMSILNNELNNLCEWFSANKLSLNVSKTNYILFSNIHKRNEETINNETIENVQVSKFLGLYVDDRLNWKQHIDYVQTKLSKTTAIMNKMRNLLHENALRTLYSSLFLPHLNYCSAIWGNTYKSNLRKITVLQKKAIRITCKVAPRSLHPAISTIEVTEIHRPNKF